MLNHHQGFWIVHNIIVKQFSIVHFYTSKQYERFVLQRIHKTFFFTYLRIFHRLRVKIIDVYFVIIIINIFIKLNIEIWRTFLFMNCDFMRKCYYYLVSRFLCINISGCMGQIKNVLLYRIIKLSINKR